jgi:hypothetical protein
VLPRTLRYLHSILCCLPATAFAVNLQDHVWQSRLLFVVAPDVADPQVERVRASLEHHRWEILDRDLLVFQLFLTGQNRIDDRPIGAHEARKLRAALGLAAGDRTLVLVGKDGSVKRRAPLSVDLREIFRQIDAMPMRRQELRERRPDSPDRP